MKGCSLLRVCFFIFLVNFSLKIYSTSLKSWSQFLITPSHMDSEICHYSLSYPLLLVDSILVIIMFHLAFWFQKPAKRRTTAIRSMSKISLTNKYFVPPECQADGGKVARRAQHRDKTRREAADLGENRLGCRIKPHMVRRDRRWPRTSWEALNRTGVYWSDTGRRTVDIPENYTAKAEQ